MASCIARQPILDVNLKIFAYELLYRSTEKSEEFDGIDADAASSETIMNSFHEMDISRVTNGKRAFINFTEKLLLDNVATILPRRILVIELLENILPTEEVLAACTNLRKRGYLVALDDFRIEPDYMRLLEVADIVKIDFVETPREVIKKFVNGLSGKSIRFLAEKVESYEDFEFAKELGFTLFQGYFFSKPSLVRSDVEMSPLRINCLRLIRLAFDPNADFTKITSILKQDVALSYRLLRVVNSAYFGLRYSVNNIRQALAILGMDELKKWVTLISMSEIKEGKPDELIAMSLVRARFLETVAQHVGLSKHTDDMFMLGLMSLMDAITDMPFEDVAKLTQISDELVAALTEREGKYGDMLSLAIEYERCGWAEALEIAEKYGLAEETLVDEYLAAVDWTNSFM